MKTASPSTPENYLASLPPDRSAALTTLHRAIVKAAPALEPHILYGMLGYGKFLMPAAGGRGIESSVVALASQKQHMSLYLSVTNDEGYLPEQHKARLGKVSVGRSCIRFKKIDNLNLPVVLELVKEAAQLAKKQSKS